MTAGGVNSSGALEMAIQWVRDQLAKDGVSIPLPTGN